MNIILFLSVGVISGWLANVLIRGRDWGVLVNTIIGIIGAFVGGAMFNGMGWTVHGFWESVGVSVIGAIVFLMIVSLLAKFSRLTRKHQLNAPLKETPKTINKAS
jgi:uncharacterized membrane protein YeaQ/YmgE (transglycosylase-associated protein family)